MQRSIDQAKQAQKLTLLQSGALPLQDALLFQRCHCFVQDQVINPQEPRSHGERSRSPRQKAKPKASTEPSAQTEELRSFPPKQRTKATEASMEKPKPILLKSHQSFQACCTNIQPLPLEETFHQKDMGQSTLTQGTPLPLHRDLTWAIQDQFSRKSGHYLQFPTYFSRRHSCRVRHVQPQSFTQQRTKKYKLMTNWTSEHWTKRERDKAMSNSREQWQNTGPIKDFQVALLPNVREHFLLLFYYIFSDIFFVPSNFVSRPKPYLAICFPSPILSVYLYGDGQFCFGHTQPRSVRVRGRHVNWVGGTERMGQAGLGRISRQTREGG